MEFTEEEVKEKLKELGYTNIPNSKLTEFMKDLHQLIVQETSVAITGDEDISIVTTSCSSFGYSPTTNQIGHHRAVAFSKEKLKRRENHDDSASTVLTTTLNTSEESASSTQQKASHVRRKVARKRNGSTRIFDETLTSENESQSSDITHLVDQFKRIPLSLVDCNLRASSSSSSLPAFIRVSNKHPHERGYRKCDPVRRFHQLKEEWKYNKVPGEKSHSTLRWRVKEKILNFEGIEKRRHTYSANNYVVPTEKKRQALRWEVRSALART